MIYQQAIQATIVENEYYIYPVNWKEKLWILWTMFIKPDKLRVAIRFNGDETWFAKNCVSVPLDISRLKEIKDE